MTTPIPPVSVFGFPVSHPEPSDTVFETETVHVDPATGRRICLFFASMKKDAAKAESIGPGWIELDFEAWVVRYRIAIN